MQELKTFKAIVKDNADTQIGSDSPVKTVTIENPIINVLSVANSASGIGVGETITRTVVISNGGFGNAEYITIHDKFDEGAFTISNPSPTGTLVSTTDSGKTTTAIQYDLSANPIAQNGQRTFTYDVTLNSCSTTDPFQSEVYASWGCSLGDECKLGNSKNTSLNLKSVPQPDLVFNFPPKYTEDGCWDDLITRTATITNNGTGIATDVNLNFGPNRFKGYVGQTIDPASLSISSDAGRNPSISIDNVVKIGDSRTTCAPTSANLASGERIQKIETTISDIQPGETVTITWNEYICPFGPNYRAGSFIVAGVNYEYSSKNICF